MKKQLFYSAAIFACILGAACSGDMQSDVVPSTSTERSGNEFKHSSERMIKPASVSDKDWEFSTGGQKCEYIWKDELKKCKSKACKRKANQDYLKCAGQFPL